MLVPGGILVAAALFAVADLSLPPSLAGLRSLAPYTVLGLAGAVTLCSGTTGCTGPVLVANSLVGSTAGRRRHHFFRASAKTCSDPVA